MHTIPCYHVWRVYTCECMPYVQTGKSTCAGATPSAGHCPPTLRVHGLQACQEHTTRTINSTLWGQPNGRTEWLVRHASLPPPPQSVTQPYTLHPHLPPPWKSNGRRGPCLSRANRSSFGRPPAHPRTTARTRHATKHGGYCTSSSRQPRLLRLRNCAYPDGPSPSPFPSSPPVPPQAASIIMRRGTLPRASASSCRCVVSSTAGASGGAAVCACA